MCLLCFQRKNDAVFFFQRFSRARFARWSALDGTGRRGLALVGRLARYIDEGWQWLALVGGKSRLTFLKQDEDCIQISG